MSTRSLRNALLIAAFAGSDAVFGQPAPAATEPETRLIEQIAAMRAEQGPSPAGLIELLRDLALLYESAGDHALAIVALEEARYITRVHQGLSSADEALLLREQIRNEKALGNDQRVWDFEQQMAALARQHYDDIRMATVFRDLAEDRADALEEYRAGGFPPEIVLGCYYAAGPRGLAGDVSCSSGSSDAVSTQFRGTILAYYTEAIEVLVKAGDYASQELRELEKQAFRFRFTDTVFLNLSCPATLDELVALELVGTCLEPINSGVGNWAGLVRLIAYENRAGAPPAARAKAFAELADWHLVVTPADRRPFSDMSDAAFKIYEGAYRLLALDGDALAIAEIYSPELPVTLPTLRPNPFASSAEAEPSRYIDVAFDVTKYGAGERIQILETSKNATRAEKRDLIRVIETTTFRPRFADGNLAESAPVVVRYSLSPRGLRPRQ